ICRAARRIETLRADALDCNASPKGINAFSKLLCELVLCYGEVLGQSDRCQRAVAGPPKRLADLERDEGLRCRGILFPILFVDRPDAPQVERERRIPVPQA